MSEEIQNLQEMVKSLEAQLVDLYAEKQSSPLSSAQANQAIESLEQQVIALVDEKMELERQLHEMQRNMERMKEKSKLIGAAIMEAALFDADDASSQRKAA